MDSMDSLLTTCGQPGQHATTCGHGQHGHPATTCGHGQHGHPATPCGHATCGHDATSCGQPYILAVVSQLSQLCTVAP